MELHVTLASAPPSAFPAREIVVDTTALRTGSALVDRLQAAGYSGPFTVGGTPLAALIPHSGDLMQGAVIVCGTSPATTERSRLPHLLLVMHSGPDAGQMFPLTRGSYTIGRAASDIVFADPALSRNHALLTVTEDSILLEDLDSVNGTFVDGESITTASITVAAALRLGASRCSIELIDDPGWTAAGTGDVLEPLPVGLDVPKKPSQVLVLTALLPLVLGVVLALTTGMWFFLAFSALSAVTGLVPLLTYRRSAAAFTSAVRDAAQRDRGRRYRAVPDAGQIAIDALRAARPAASNASREAQATPHAVLLRLGLADQPANLSVGRTDAPFTPPLLRNVPLLVPCSPSGNDSTRTRTFTVAGDAEAVRGVMRALLLQVAHPRSGAVSVVCWGPARALPHHARFLPNVRLTHDPRVLASFARIEGVLLLFQLSEDIPEMAGAADVFVIRFLLGSTPAVGTAPGTAGTVEATMTLAAGVARAWISGHGYEVTPDRVSARTFERTARDLARAAALDDGSRSREPLARTTFPGLPRSASLWSEDLMPGTLETSMPRRWSSSDPKNPTAHLGQSARGRLSINLVKDGPHLLVGGTTGSGKSEFLRTLVLGLALDQPPENLTMLLIDYKGGSGLGALAALPHCVGYLTDLSSESTARALTSLRAELRRREGLCAEWGAHDLDELRTVSPSSCPPRLVVVIDEFRMLSDDVPTAVPDLMKIAALGRSLGVHLILATQRVQGTVTPDMRANITSSVLLRVQTALESQDLLGSAVAAQIPIDLPGRAFLRRGSGGPIEFQVASSSDAPPSYDSAGWQDVDAYLGEGSADAGGAVAKSTGLMNKHAMLEQVAKALTAAVGRSTDRRPHRPVLPPLPARLSAAACAAFRPVVREGGGPTAGDSRAALTLGLADYPERQEQRLLIWHPADHSHLALIGLPGSGVAEALASLVSSLPAADPDVHLYLLDGDGSLARCSSSPQVGAHVRSSETKRAARVLERLCGLPLEGSGDAPAVVLVVSGWARWISQFRQGRSARAEEDLHALVRDGATTGVTVIVAGDRELTTSRFFALMPNRVYLPLGAHQETTMTWPKMPQIDALVGRGFAQGRITGSSGEGVCQLILDDATAELENQAPALPPFRVHPLPSTIDVDVLYAALPPRRAQESDGLVLGVYGDDLRTYSITLGAGEAYLVLGHAASGRTTALRVLAESASRFQPHRTVLSPSSQASGPEVIAYWRGLPTRADDVDWSSCILLVDDADRLPTDVQNVLSGLVGRGAATVLSARPGPSLMTRVPLSLQARAMGRGFVLSPKSPNDGDVFGVRLDVEGTSIPGRGYACEPSGAVEVQLARASDGRPPESTSHGAGQGGATAFFRPRSSAR